VCEREREREEREKKRREERDLSTNVLLLCFYPFFPKIKTQEVEEENQDWSLVLPGLMQVFSSFFFLHRQRLKGCESLSSCEILSNTSGLVGGKKEQT